MNGVYPPNSNRYADLDPDRDKQINRQRNKRTRLDPTDFVPLPTKQPNYDDLPRFLIASATSLDSSTEVKPLASYNVFQIGRGIKHICHEYTEITELRSGDLMIKANNLKAAKKFLNAKFIDVVPVKIVSHATLNSSQGLIFCDKIKNISEEDILKDMSEFNVIGVRKFMKKEGDNLISTGGAVITFNLIHPPEWLDLGWRTVKVYEYIPNPLKCNNCQKLGHTKNHCRGIQLCKECGIPPPHNPCNRKFCVNCNNDTHTSYDPTCLSFLTHKSVNKIKAKRRCTARDAWKIFKEDPINNLIAPHVPKKSYAHVLGGINIPLNPTASLNQNKKHETNSNSNIDHTNSLPSRSLANSSTSKTLAISSSSASHSLNSTPLNSVSTPSSLKTLSTPSNSLNTATITNQIIINTNNKTKNKINMKAQNVIATSDEDLSDVSAITTSNLHTSTTTNNNGITQPDFSGNRLLTTPPRMNVDELDDGTSPCSQAFKKFPQLNVLITPKTYRETLSNMSTNSQKN